MAGIGSRIGRLGRRVLAAHRSPQRAGGIRLARSVASRHRPPLLEAATRLARAHRRGPAAAPPRARASAVRDPHLSDFAMEWMFGAGDLTDFAVEGVPEAEGPPSFMPAAPEPPAAVRASEPPRRFEEFGPFRLSRVPAGRGEEAPTAAHDDGGEVRSQKEPAESEPVQESTQPDLSTSPAEQPAARVGRAQAEAPEPAPAPRAGPQPLSIRRVERTAESPSRPVVARRRREPAPPSPVTPASEPQIAQPADAPSQPLLARIVSRVFRRRPSPPAAAEPLRADVPAAEQPRVLARRAARVAPDSTRERESGAAPSPAEPPVSSEPEPAGEPAPEPEPEVEIAVDGVSADLSELPAAPPPPPRVVVQRVELSEREAAKVREQPLARVVRTRTAASSERATAVRQPLRALRRAAASVARLPWAAARGQATPSTPPVQRAAVDEPAPAEELPAVTAVETTRVERRPEPVRLRSVARAAGGEADRPREPERFVHRAKASALAAATGATLARETAELASVTFASPPEPLVSEPSIAPVLARASDEGETTAPPAPAAGPAPEAPVPHAAHDPGVDYDQIYDHVIRQLRRDLLREREQMGDLLGDLY